MDDRAPRAQPALRLLAIGIALVVMGVVVRVDLLGPEFAERPLFRSINTLRNSAEDVAVAIALTAVFLAGHGLLKRWQRTVRAAFFVTAGMLLALAVINVLAVRLIGGPLTAPWLHHADLFRSFTPQSAIAPLLDAKFFLRMLLALVGLWAVARLVTPALTGLQRRKLLPLALGAIAAGLALYFAAVSRAPPLPGEAAGLARNPLLELASTWLAYDSEQLADPSLAVAPEPLPAAQNDPARLPPGLDSGIRNIVLVVMESVPAKYIGGPDFARRTPRLASLQAHTLAFTNFYSHVPQSTKSLFSLVASHYPLLAFENETERYPEWPWRTLGQRMRGAGLRTAFFMSGDLRYQGVDGFLAGKGFGTVADMRHIPCAGRTIRASTSVWRFADAAEDSCTAAALTRWVDEAPDTPFFAVMWTGNTHFPYFPAQFVTPAMGDDRFARYLGALRASDEAIGRVLAYLRAEGLDRSTLVIVTGDHGQAFMEHGYGTHANTVYDEESRVPLLLIHPGIAGPATNAEIAGFVDIAPTLLHLLGQQPEPTWQGRSLFDAHRPPRQFMFAANRAMVVGYREGPRKFIYWPGRDATELYDLSNDPEERLNLVTPRAAREGKGRIAGWHLAQQRSFRAVEAEIERRANLAAP